MIAYLVLATEFLTTLDLSNNLSLNQFVIRYAGLAELDLENNVALQTLTVADLPNLQALKLPASSSLLRAEINNTQIETLDISQNIDLQYLILVNNLLSCEAIENAVTPQHHFQLACAMTP